MLAGDLNVGALSFSSTTVMLSVASVDLATVALSEAVIISV